MWASDKAALIHIYDPDDKTRGTPGIYRTIPCYQHSTVKCSNTGEYLDQSPYLLRIVLPLAFMAKRTRMGACDLVISRSQPH